MHVQSRQPLHSGRVLHNTQHTCPLQQGGQIHRPAIGSPSTGGAAGEVAVVQEQADGQGGVHHRLPGAGAVVIPAMAVRLHQQLAQRPGERQGVHGRQLPHLSTHPNVIR